MNPSLTTMRSHARRIWRAGVDAADPGRLMAGAVSLRRGGLEAGGLRISLNEIERMAVVGAGKAGAGMAEALEAILGQDVMRAAGLHGCVNVPDATVRRLRRITLHGSRSKPDNRPTRQGVAGGRRILSILDALGPDDLLICLFSGGGSSLLPAPVPGVSLASKRRATAQLQEAGATIEDLNAVRKHLSLLKGGGIARRAPCRVLSLILSDVVGDRLDIIASGPTSPDPTTYAQAIEVLQRHRLWEKTPAEVRGHLTEGSAGRYPETLKSLPPRVENRILGGNRTALEGAEQAARGLGYRVLNLGTCLEGEAAQAGVFLAGVARQVRDRRGPVRPPACILAGGETIVRLGREHGLGGRNQELALAGLSALGPADSAGIVILSGGTDGEDGPTDAAGATADAARIQRADRLGLDAGEALAQHDSYRFFEPVGGLLKTGLTGTNVMDLQVVLVAAR